MPTYSLVPRFRKNIDLCVTTAKCNVARRCLERRAR